MEKTVRASVLKRTGRCKNQFFKTPTNLLPATSFTCKSNSTYCSYLSGSSQKRKLQKKSKKQLYEKINWKLTVVNKCLNLNSA